jgi:4-oxalocrotonate tautomerase
VKALAGRTVDQKRRLVKDITEAVIKNFKVDPEDVRVDIIEYSRENLAKAGKLFIDH